MNRVIDKDVICPFCKEAYFADNAKLAYHLFGDCCSVARKEYIPEVGRQLTKLRIGYDN